jgi:hypothetical protein
MATSKLGNPLMVTAAETHVLKNQWAAFSNVIWNCTADGNLVLAKDASSAEASNVVTISGSAGQTYDVFNGVERNFSNLYVRTLSGGTVYFHKQ